MTSGSVCPAMITASCPVAASPTTSKPSSSSMSTSILRTCSVSSTMRTLAVTVTLLVLFSGAPRREGTERRDHALPIGSKHANQLLRLLRVAGHRQLECNGARVCAAADLTQQAVNWQYPVADAEVAVLVITGLIGEMDVHQAGEQHLERLEDVLSRQGQVAGVHDHRRRVGDELVRLEPAIRL